MTANEMGWHSRWRMRRINKFISGSALGLLNRIYLNLNPNSGTSIKDQISRLETKVCNCNSVLMICLC
jgi:hypothetical protein